MKKTLTIDDVAEALGMHKSTVSKALSGTGTISARTAARVRTAAQELGYEPNPLAQRLAHGTSKALVCIVSGPLDVGLGTNKILLIQNQLAEHSLEVPIYNYAGPAGVNGELQATQIQQVCRLRPRAMVCAGSMIHPAVYPQLEAYQRSGGIVVSYDMPAPLQCDQVIFDREDNAYQAARHLLEHGHRKIGLAMSRTADWSKDALKLPQNQRTAGFTRALDEFGVPWRRDWLFLNPPYEEGGEEMARSFLALDERPTGVCIVNDYVALAFMDEVIRAGVRVPEEISVVSHDNQRIAAHCPVPMTSVSHPVDQIAGAVIKLLMERLDGFDGPPRTVTIKGELVGRQSVATLTQ